ncbi:HlyD family efflux transporter periplasmic adaptor subunit [Gilvimarinus agarilyticus]|uniref:HlyD family efflux transporter periplasmic adaptor subunit n=1 Tax=Gilvimarinus sp. 2_MG-2023 TaxID=3062666 RepID=UPI001C0A4D39|nr:HlyD family efflux transporter periplasmic adaptor subunit [Gilvimarinus sp. 2_MG-2023]MBU2884504.1 HlyD family efflux transporter periplasmic adaptor subunit [Gilvimarinus agarilyticus]MDO6569633.1 HlyD family efflux transporter periplasmic adaptor subunit [Gilvimarinus sp. 2_MG-2023]
MLSNPVDTDTRLSQYHTARHGAFVYVILVAVLAFIVWANVFTLDEVARAQAEVITPSRIQVIQAVDGGVLHELHVREGDRVSPGQELARLDPTRFAASVGEIEARLYALKAKAARLRAEVIGAESLTLSDDIRTQVPEVASVELALFEQRRQGLADELRILREGVALSRKELSLVQSLRQQGDASGAELLRAERTLNEAESRLVNRRNQFYEDARQELTRAEDESAQAEQLLIQRQEEQASSVFRATVPGIVKNIRVTTVGGVLRAGDELMQIVPAEDNLILQARVSPADIGRVETGLSANIRLDPFDYTIHGTVQGKVTYVSADTLKEETADGVDIYYRVHIEPIAFPVTTTTGKKLTLSPGMTSQVDIRTGERSLINFLLKPIRKTLSSSLGEE